MHTHARLGAERTLESVLAAKTAVERSSLLTGSGRKLFPALSFASNSLAARASELSGEDVAYVLAQHEHWLETAVHLFVDARLRLEHPSVVAELDENLSEEFGTRLQGLSHFRLMQRCYREELDLPAQPCEGTTALLIATVQKYFRAASNSALLGALLGFESFATDEFRTIQLLTARRCKLLGLSKRPLLDVYDAEHVSTAVQLTSPEDQHAERMLTAVSEAMAEASLRDWAEFAAGFFHVCRAFQTWWDAILEDVSWRSFGSTSPSRSLPGSRTLDAVP